MRPTTLAIFGLVVGCGGRAGPAADFREHDDPAAAASIERTRFALAIAGHPVGHADEALGPGPLGRRFTRHEVIELWRDGVRVTSELELVIDCDRDLAARRITVDRRVGAHRERGEAERSPRGWQITWDGEPARWATAAAEPAELVLRRLRLRGAQRFAGAVLLAGDSLAVANLAIAPAGDHLVTTLAGDAGAATSALWVDRAGLVRALGEDASAQRIERDEVVPAEAVDALALGRIAIAGRPGRGLRLAPIGRAPPRGLPGLRAIADGDGWRVGPGDDDDAWPALADRARALVAGPVAAALDSPGLDARAARALGRADCTGLAAVAVADAEAAGLEAQVVTGWLIDDGALVRHRWVALRQPGGAWVAIDPALGEAPADPASHLALTMHGASAAELDLAAELAYGGLGAVAAAWVDD